MSRFQVSLLLLSTLLFSGIRSIPPLCSPAEPWSVNGRDLVGQYKGRLLLLAFMPMRCESCALEFKKLNAIGMKLREIKVVVVAPQHETPEDVRRAAEDYRYVEIVQETAREPLWRWLDVTANDRLIFDSRTVVDLLVPDLPLTTKLLLPATTEATGDDREDDGDHEDGGDDEEELDEQVDEEFGHGA
ncbi:hypothetical protein QR680_012095 [Steinernema hermaphroditum]|uniref:Thioredoxin domain-containing protein n=1 Tax=Steinernema hermaphroditum TaxID=289476 RepID=A0AA39LZY1_9BILA|nr:hypothetical protein QR680_012095 [Steinernema hermaphroditum]